MPTVSVVIPTCNSGPYLAEAVDSVLVQTFNDFELILVDSNSADNTLELIAAYSDPRISLINLPYKCGASIPRNMGFLAATGEFVAIMDSDDRMRPTRLQQQVAFFRQRSEVDIVGSNFTLFQGERQSQRLQPPGYAEIKAKLLIEINGLFM